MSLARGSLSAHTPPTSASSTSGMAWQASTMPRSVPEPVRSSTAKVSATGVMPSPNTETLWARNTLRKSRERSRPALSRRRAGMSRDGDMPRVYRRTRGREPRGVRLSRIADGCPRSTGGRPARSGYPDRYPLSAVLAAPYVLARLCAHDVSLVAPRAAHSAMMPVTVAKPNVTAKPTSSAVVSQPVFSRERIESNT